MWTHVDACGGGSKTRFFVDVINGWPLICFHPRNLDFIAITLLKLRSSKFTKPLTVESECYIGLHVMSRPMIVTLVSWLDMATYVPVAIIYFWRLWCLLYSMTIMNNEHRRSLGGAARARGPSNWEMPMFLSAIGTIWPPILETWPGFWGAKEIKKLYE